MERTATSSAAADPVDAAPDSWETADIDQRLSQLLLSPPKVSSLTPTLSSTLPNIPADPGTVLELDQFLREALEKPRERISILRMEQEILKFIKDPRRHQQELKEIPTSYLRLAAHRLAQHYHLQSIAMSDSSSLDGSSCSSIMLLKTPDCQLPAVYLADLPVSLPQESRDVGKVAIKQRPQQHSKNAGNLSALSSKINLEKSVEQRKEEYDRARARIFSGSSSNSNSDNASNAVPNKTGNVTGNFCQSFAEGMEICLGRSVQDSSLGSIRPSRIGADEVPSVSRFRPTNKVAIFRDHEMDSRDPDYNRNYDRYMQRFDPGFGFVESSHSIQPLYSPAVNYNTEFPQLGSQRSQLPLEPQLHFVPQHAHGPWSGSTPHSPIGYRHPEGMIPPFNHVHIGVRMRSPIYVPSSQYPPPPHARVGYPLDSTQNFMQSQLPGSNFDLARPR